MVFASIRAHGSAAVFIASTSSDEICLASSEYFRKKSTCKQRTLRKFTVSNNSL